MFMLTVLLAVQRLVSEPSQTPTSCLILPGHHEEGYVCCPRRTPCRCRVAAKSYVTQLM